MIGFSVFQLLITLTSAFANFNFSFSSEVTSNNLLRGHPVSSCNTFPTGYEPKASDARRFDTRFASYEQVICRDDAIVCPHLQSKIQESYEDRG